MEHRPHTADQDAYLEQAIQPALHALLQTGSFVPTLYAQGDGGLAQFTFVSQAMGELRADAAKALREKVDHPTSYALVYPSTLRFGDHEHTVLIIETGDAGSDVARELARRYSRKEQSVAERFDRLGTIDNLLFR